MTNAPSPVEPSRRGILVVALLLVLAVGGAAAYYALRIAAPATPSAAAAAPLAAAQFVGRAQCAGCHASQDAAWKADRP